MATGRVRETGRFRSGSPSLREAQREAAEEMAREPALKKGGKVKAYANGGSVRGGGCETRTKKTKYV
jgi:Arc/MetJ-type ribon-helix-helix transcriptional regulator